MNHNIISPSPASRSIAVGKLRAFAGLLALVLGCPLAATAQITNTGHALAFNGTTNAVVMHSGFQGFPSTNITVEFWARSPDTTRNGSLVSYGAGGNPNAFLIYDHKNISVWINNVATISSGVSIADGAWHHIAVTWSASGTLQIFKDGNLVFSTTHQPGYQFGNGGTLVLGQDQDTIGGGFDETQAFAGEMDEVRVWSVIRTPAQIAQNLNTALAGNEQGLVAYYRFNEGVGSNGADATGLAHTASLSSGIYWVSHAPFMVSGALDVANGSVQIPSATALNTLPMTVMGWMRVEGTGVRAKYPIVRAATNSFNWDWWMSVDPDGTLSAGFIGGPSSSISIQKLLGGNAGPVNDGLWHHTAFVVDTNGGRLFVDGVLRAARGWSGVPMVANSTNAIYLGFPDFPFNGQLDEVSLWNVAMDASALQTNMHRRLTGSESGLLAVYRLDETVGSLVADSSPNARNGTVISNVQWTTSGARIHGTDQISGQILAAGAGAPNIPVSATLPPVTKPGPMSIPDLGTTTATTFIATQNGTIGYVRVAVNMTHSFVGDLELTLIAPDGTEVRLKNAEPTDESKDVVTSYPDLTVPVQSLAALNGKSIVGLWGLRIRDLFASDTGTLNSWSLQFGGSAAVTEANGKYTLNSLLTHSNFYAQAYSVQPVVNGFVFDPPGAISPAGRTDVNFTLLSGFISGRVEDLGVGLPGVTVNAGNVSTTADADGKYLLTGVPPPEATLIASRPGYAFSPAQYVGVPLGVTNADFTVAGYPVAGRVIDLQSNGVPGVTVTGGLQSASTDGQGHYLLAGLPSGLQTITPTKPGVLFSPTNSHVVVGPALSNVNFTAIQSPPTITRIPDQLIAKGASTGALRFDVTDAETRAGLLRIEGSSGNTSLVPNANIVFGGAGAQRTVTVTPAPDQAGTTLLTITVTDESNLSTSTNFMLRVNQPPLPGVGLALSFNGASNSVAAASGVIGNKGTFSVEAWAFAHSNSGPRTLLSQSAAFSIGLDAAGQIRVGTNWNTGVSFPFGAWHHLAVVREAANTRLYLNGVLRASRGSALPYPPQNAAFRVGALAASEFWLGSIDEVRVWNVARTAAEISSYANVRVTGNESGLGGLWRFDEAPQFELAYDSSPFGRFLAISGPVRTESGVRFNTYVAPVGRPISDVLQAYDADGDPVTFALVDLPNRGDLELANPASGDFAYTGEGTGSDQFSFTVSDGYGTSDAHPVSIILLADTNRPIITPIADQVTPEDTLLGPVGFLINDGERPPDRLTVTARSSDQTLVPDTSITLAGTGQSRTLTLLPATNRFGSAVITVTVSDGAQQASTSFNLTVTPIHDPPILHMTNMVVGNGQTFNQPIIVTFVDPPTGPVNYSVSFVAGFYVYEASLSTCTYSDGALPCVTMRSIEDNYYNGVSSIRVTVADGSATSQVIFDVAVNSSPAFMSSVPDQYTLRDVPTKPITSFWYVDNDTPRTNLSLTFIYSNALLLSDTSFRFDSFGGLYIVPNAHRSGESMITATVYDGVSSDTVTFRLVVEDPVNYEVVELPRLPGAGAQDVAKALRLNDNGQIVGWASLAGTRRAALWDVNGPTPTVTSLLPTPSVAFDINNLGHVVGQNTNKAFLYRNGGITDLGAEAALDINDLGDITGVQATQTNDVAFFINGTSSAVTTLTDFYVLSYGDDRSLALNAAGDVFGAAVAFIPQPFPAAPAVWMNRTNRQFSTLNQYRAPLYDPVVGGINNNGWICLNHYNVSENQNYPILFNYRAGTNDPALLPALSVGLPEAVRFYARDINDGNQVVGVGVTFFGEVVPFLYTQGKAYRLVELMPGSGITPTDVRAINNAGDILGLGTRPGASGFVSFLLRNRVFVGEAISPPAQAINPVTGSAFSDPAVAALDGTPAAEVSMAYVWSRYEQKLFFVRPMLASVSWQTSTNLLGTNSTTLLRQYRITWPASPQVHIVGAPAGTMPVSASSPYRPFTLRPYRTAPGAALDPSSKTFNTTGPGYSVIHYLIDPGSPIGSTPDFMQRSNHFEVVRSYEWDDPAVLTNIVLPAQVGTKISDPRGPAVATNSLKSGWVINTVAPYDGTGPDRAYDRTTQTGPIIPVNVDRPTTTSDDLVVAFYRLNNITKTLWPDLSAQFAISWPTNAETLVIANPLGSGPLPDAFYPDKRIYNQPDPLLPGFNPNEEHAFLAPSAAGQGVFALRNDLNRANTSSNYVLLKYRNPANNEWQMKPFRVELTDANNTFQFDAIAGQELLPPYPLSLFTVCEGTTNLLGNVFRDFKGKYYALAGPTPQDQHPSVVMRYFYPLQPGFYYDTNADTVDDFVLGRCVPWDGVSAPAQTSKQIEVSFSVKWPANVPVLSIGETLLNAKNGLPGIKNWASAQVVFDPYNQDDLSPKSSSIRLYDPLSPRVLPLTRVSGVTSNYNLPAEIDLQTVGGKQIFPDLPYHLRSRLSYDPVGKSLSFAGFLDESVVGEPLLLVNVLSSTEAARIKQLSGEPNFRRIVDALYDLTRNPNRVNTIFPGVEPPERDLLIGLTTRYTVRDANGERYYYGLRPTGTNLTIVATNVVQEPLGDAPKALTAGVPVPWTPTNFGNAVSFDGIDDMIAAADEEQASDNFTVSLWFKTTATGTAPLIAFRDTQTGQPQFPLDRQINIRNGHIDFYCYPHSLSSSGVFNDGQWHHVAATLSQDSGLRLYVDGELVAAESSSGSLNYTGYWRVGNVGNSWFQGVIDDVRIWDTALSQSQILATRGRPATGNEIGLKTYWRFDESSGSVVSSSGLGDLEGLLFGNPSRIPSSVSASARYVVLAQNNDPALTGLPVSLQVILVDGGPFRGDLKTILPDNVFDERLTLRHSADFGGDPDRLEFEWWYHPDDADFDPTRLPTINPDGSIADARGWFIYTPALTPDKRGQNTITIGDGGETSHFTLADNWFISRYRGYDIAGQTNWSPWVGDPASTTQTRASFAPGWAKRVIEGINPFEARTRDFHKNAANTFASMLIQAGQRYEGDIAFNPDGGNLLGIGLIEAYTTVLNRGRKLSIDGTPPVDSDPLNNALLLAASRISDLYMLLGNEAFADAQDPTIGFLADSPELGALATATFAFKNQLDSLLDEELALLRGRDDSASGVGARPVYNRLLWNFTGSEGEVAYQRTYNITDVNADGVINEFDARILNPQGHGDAWGHYLTALKTYYELLRHPRFTWVPRPENVLIAGTSVRVDFLDERKFASAAAAKARAGSELVDLTYRAKYVDDPEGQYQGYKDTRPDRAWGVTEWARRAGQGAYFDWLVGNAILPATDPDPAHTGIQKIDRQTVRELDEILSQHQAIQARIDMADSGLNPLGLAKGAVTFDIDPNFNIVGSGIQGQRHFQQVYDRALKAMNNCVAVWNQANQLGEALRRSQDSIDEFTANVAAQERDYKNRLIEIFGYPYAGDIGPGKTYPTGYDGPDLYHYMYVNVTELTGAAVVPTNILTGYFAPFPEGTNAPNFYFSDDFSAGNFSPGPVLNVQFPMAKDGWAFTAPTSFGARRAPGELQLALSDLLQEETRLKIALGNYDAILRKIRESATLLQSRVALRTTTINLVAENTNKLYEINNTIQGLQDGQLALRSLASTSKKLSEASADTLPSSPLEILKVFKTPVILGFTAASIVMDSIADGLEGAQNRQERAKEETQLQTDLQIQIASDDYELKQQAAELLSLFRDEGTLRLEAFNQAELVKQTFARFKSVLATGQRLAEERIAFRQRTAGTTQRQRYEDMTFRVFRNQALQKYRAQFDLAARYVYLAAAAYDYELNFLGNDNRSGSDFFTDIIRQRSLGPMVDGEPLAGSSGLADPLGRLNQNFAVLQSRFGLNNPEFETSRFSLRRELFRLRDDSDAQWRSTLRQALVRNLWDLPEFRRYCRPFAPESAGPQPGLVIRFPTTITSGLNFFGFPLGGGDSAYDPSLFTTKINSVGVWFEDYNSAGLATAPRVYLVPVGMDVQRSPTGNTLATREWRIVDQAIPVPFPIGSSELQSPAWIPINDSLSESLAQIRRFASFRAYHDAGVYDDTETTRSTRLIGRSVWNTDWILIIPGGTFLFDPDQGLETFINSVGDIKISLQSYSYTGD